MIKAEVVFDGDYIEINNLFLKVECSENDTWYVDIDGIKHDKTLEQAIKYCMEN